MPVVSPEAKRLAFLTALASCDTVKAAAEKAGLSQPMVYAWRKEFPQFAADWLEIRTVRKEALADKGLRAVEQIIDDETHKDRFSASKWAAERVEGPSTATQRGEGADGIAEAIDRFTATVLALAERQPARDLPPAPPSRPGLAALVAPGEGES